MVPRASHAALYNNDDGTAADGLDDEQKQPAHALVPFGSVPSAQQQAMASFGSGSYSQPQALVPFGNGLSAQQAMASFGSGSSAQPQALVPMGSHPSAATLLAAGYHQQLQLDHGQLSQALVELKNRTLHLQHVQSSREEEQRLILHYAQVAEELQLELTAAKRNESVMQDLRVALAGEKSTAATLFEDKQKSDQQVVLYQSQVGTLQTQLQELQSRASWAQGQAVAQLNSKNQELMTAAASKDQRLALVSSEVTSLQQRIKRGEEQALESSRTIQQRDSSIGLLEAEKQMMQSQINKAAKDLSTSRAEALSLSGELSRAKDLGRAIEARLNTLQTTHTESLRKHGVELAARDGRITQLQGEAAARPST